MPPKKFIDQYRETLRAKHYSHRTEETYIKWVRQYIRFRKMRQTPARWLI